MNRFDILVAQRVNSFKLTDILSEDLPKYSKGTNGDYFEYYGVDPKTTDFVIGQFMWYVESMTVNEIKLSTKPHAQRCVVEDIRNACTYNITRCSINITLNFNDLLNEAKTDDSWFDFYAKIEIEDLSPKTIADIKQAMFEYISKRRKNIKEIFFKKEVSTAFRLHDNVTSSTFFILQADKGMEYAYFCMGQMLDDRKLPAKPVFNEDTIKDLPAFIFHLSPYAYFSIGLKPKIEEKYPNNPITFDEENNRLVLHHLPMDRDTIASTLKISKDKVDHAEIPELAFSLNNSYFSYDYRMHLHINDTKWLVIPDPYTVDAESKQYYKMFLKNRHCIDVDELRNMHEYRVSKRADIPIIDDFTREIEGKLLLIGDLLMRVAIPLAIDLGIGLNPVVGCVLFSLFNSLTDMLEDAYKITQEQQTIEEARQLDALEVSFKKLMPFNLNDISIKKVAIQDGLVISGDIPSDIHFLLKGDSLYSGERIVGKNAQLVFEKNGDLVFYKTENEFPQPSDELWRYSKNWQVQNFKSGASKIVFDPQGGLLAYGYKPNDEIDPKWDIYLGTRELNFLYVTEWGFGMAYLDDKGIKSLGDMEKNYSTLYLKENIYNLLRYVPSYQNIAIYQT